MGLVSGYRIFFPVGLVYAIWGACLWIEFWLGRVSYPGALHAQMMVNGFVLSFAFGFLVTAIPQFLDAPEVSRAESALACVLSASFAVSAAIGEAGLALRPAIGALMLVLLAAFFVRRFRHRRSGLPAHFLFIPLGLLSGIVGSVLLAVADFGRLGPRAYDAGRLLAYQSMMLCLTLGVGGRLVTALLGWSELPDQVARDTVLPWRDRAGLICTLALCTTAGFGIELAGYVTFGRVTRALVATFIAFGSWRLYRWPAERTTLARSLWCAGWLLLLGLWVYAVLPAAEVHALHLMFIGGFGLMSLMIATRVSIAHGNADFELEVRSWPLRITTAAIVLAAITRATAVLFGSYIPHLAYAAIVWVIGLVVWSLRFLRIAIRADHAHGSVDTST